MNTASETKKDLPFEILYQVFEQLSFADQVLCQAACKSWSRAALACANKSLEVY